MFFDRRPSARTLWPAYDSTPLYGRTSLAGLESDIRTVSETWFRHDSHNSVEELVCALPLAYFRFSAHDRYVGSTRYQTATLFRVFVLQECHGWEHETALVGYLGDRPELCEQLGFETIPDQSTLWRSWHERFTADLRETVETAARTILIKAQNAGVAVPREPARKLRYHGDESGESDPDDQITLGQAENITDHVSRIVFPAFSLERGAAVRYTRTLTGVYRRISDFVRVSQPTRAVVVSPTRVEETEEFFRAGIIAIDITEADPFTGDRTGHEDEIIGTKEKTDEYAYQWATVQLVGNAVPIVLDARPVQKGESRLEIVKYLLDSTEEMVHVDNVLMDREFDSQHVLEMPSRCGLSYLVPKRLQTNENAQAKRLLRRDQDRYETDRKLHLGKNEWHETTLSTVGKKTLSTTTTGSTRCL